MFVLRSIAGLVWRRFRSFQICGSIGVQELCFGGLRRLHGYTLREHWCRVTIEETGDGSHLASHEDGF